MPPTGLGDNTLPEVPPVPSKPRLSSPMSSHSLGCDTFYSSVFLTSLCPQAGLRVTPWDMLCGQRLPGTGQEVGVPSALVK